MIKSDVVCEECGEIRMKTPSGACCPNGCGRIKPGVTAAQLREGGRIKFAEGLPEFEPESSSRRVYSHAGKRFLSTYVKGVGTSKVYRVRPGDKPREGCVLGRDEKGLPRCFRLSPRQPK